MTKQMWSVPMPTTSRLSISETQQDGKADYCTVFQLQNKPTLTPCCICIISYN